MIRSRLPGGAPFETGHLELDFHSSTDYALDQEVTRRRRSTTAQERISDELSSGK